MKLPLTPPDFRSLFLSMKPDKLGELMSRSRSLDDGDYQHWDKLRHRPPPEGLTHEEWWACIKLGRTQTARSIDGFVATNGQPFQYCLPDAVLEAVHDIDSRARGAINLSEQVTAPGDRDRYMVSSLIEEAITSSQLEGAATTRKVAADMLRSGRPPQDRSEQMILNNYRAMQHILELDDQALTPDRVLNLHRVLMQDTMDDIRKIGRLQTDNDERVRVMDSRDGAVLHTPPRAAELSDRMARLCAFANGETGSQGFLHPVIRAIILHFWLAYDHPFEDGNGRTARALFYWSMLREGYWLFEYLSISSLLRRAPGQYARSFLYTETDDNDLTYFIAYQLKIIRRSLDALNRYLARKQREVREAEAMLKETSWLNHRQRALVAHAVRNPAQEYSFASHQNSHKVAYATARSDLLQLADNGLLVMHKRRKKMLFRPGPALLAENQGTTRQ